jgi:hypothetical protein
LRQTLIFFAAAPAGDPGQPDGDLL